MTFRSLRPAYPVILAISFLLVAATRLPLMPRHLFSFDSVNLALALTDFDPSRHQPQPPGYPLFVAESRIINRVLANPENTFTTIKLLVSSIAVALVFILGREMFSAGAGFAAASLFLVNPVFWYGGLGSALRLHLALVSVVVAYFSWMSLSRGRRYFYGACIAAGLGAGFRPELAPLLFPLLGYVAWKLRCRRAAFWGLTLFIAGTLVWVSVLAVLYGGFDRMVISWTDYLSVQTEADSIVMGSSESGWRHMAGRAVIWTGSTALLWIWAIPFAWPKDPGQRAAHLLQLNFVVIWFTPAFLFHILVHIGSPAHALSTIPVVCLAGGFVLAGAGRRLSEWIGGRATAAVPLAGVLLANVALFLVPFPLPQANPAGRFRGLDSFMDALRVGTYESSYAKAKWIEQSTDQTLKQIAALERGSDRSIVILCTKNGQPDWRKIAYYLPHLKVLALEEKGDSPVTVSTARLWSSNRVLQENSGDASVRVPIPRNARLVWVIGPRSEARIKEVLPVSDALPIHYTDLPPELSNFRLGSFEFEVN